MLEQKSYYIKLFDCYGNLFSTVQTECFDLYFNYDLSLSEISDRLNISRPAISKHLKNIKSTLEKYENTLKLVQIYDSIDKVLNNIDELSKAEIVDILNIDGGEK